MPSAGNPAKQSAPILSKPDACVDLVRRFSVDVAAIAPDRAPEDLIGIAVSGGPDSMALLLLAESAYPGRVYAATVDHRLRPESAEEAAMVARFCFARGIPHQILPVIVAGPGGTQAAARDARYAALSQWAARGAIRWLMTAHHADDQAETLLLRLARGSGLAGLSGIRARRALDQMTLLRPLLQWRRQELADHVAAIATATDPSNEDPHYDRTRARALLRATPWLDPARIAATAHHLADAELALEWVVHEALRTRAGYDGKGHATLDTQGLPREIVRRMLTRIVLERESTVSGPAIETAMARLAAGDNAMIGSLLIRPGRLWTMISAPDRGRNGAN